MTADQALAWARQTVTDVLEGRVSRKLAPSYYADENLPQLAARYLENADADWLFERLKEPGYALDGKVEIVIALKEHGERGRRALGFDGSYEELLVYALEMLGLPDV